MNNKLKHEADQNYYNEKFSEFSTNMGRTWEVIGTKKHRENIPEFVKQNGNTITGALEIAEGFNSFFAGISPELAGSITITPSNINFESFIGPETGEDFIFARVTPETLNKIVGKLKTKNV